MLTMKRAQVELLLHAEEARLRHIESRIAQIDAQGSIDGYDVVVKSAPSLPFLSLHCVCNDVEQAMQMIDTVARDGERGIKATLRDKFMVVAHNDHDDDKLKLDIGYSLTRPSNAPVRAAGQLLLASELPAVEAMATIIRPGTNPTSHASFNAVGGWIEAHNYEVAGPCREVFLEPITGAPGIEGALVEIQFPLRPAA